MTSIKVTYQSTARRFVVPNTITWLDLESKLRELFSLPPTLKFSLSYTDDEGDVITLSTDLELQELLSSKSMLKFVLTPEKQQPSVFNTFSSNTSENDFVSVEKEKLIPDNVSEKIDKHINVVDVADEPSFKPTIPSISKGKQKEESPAESSTFATNNQQQEERQSSPDNNEQRAPPFIELAEQFQGLIDQFKDVFSKNPQLVEQANNVMDQILRNVPVDINQWAQWLSTFQSEGNVPTTNDQGNEPNNSRGEQQQQQHGQFPPFFPPHHSLLSSPWIQRIIQDTGTNYPSNFKNFAKPTGFNGPWNFNGYGGYPYRQQQQQQQEELNKGTGTNYPSNFTRPTGFNEPWNFNGYGSCPYRQQQQQQQEELNQETLKEKINLLHSMGFWEDDVKNEELLKKYKGNIERVVEILIREKDERINDNSMESVVDGQ